MPSNTTPGLLLRLYSREPERWELYIGYTNNLKRRIEGHNKGQPFDTKFRRPFKFIYFEGGFFKKDAKRREKYLKTTQGRRFLGLRLLEYKRYQRALGSPGVDILGMYIIKSTGEKQEFDPEKIRRTCLRAKATPEAAQRISEDITAEIQNGMKTSEIYKRVMEMLAKNSPGAALRYDLRNAIFRLGPAGFEFEKYIARILTEYGFKTELPPILQGACTTHEVDISAEKDGRRAMMECKLRQSQEIFITIKDTMSTWARFLDLVEGAGIGTCPHFDEVWLVTNSRFSHDSIQYGHCKNMVMLSWDHPRERALPAWIEQKGLYPVTVLRDLPISALSKLSAENIILLKDLITLDVLDMSKKTGLSAPQIDKLVAEAQLILGE